MQSNRTALSVAIAAMTLSLTHPTQAAGDRDEVFTLGKFTVTAHAEDERPIEAASLDREQLWNFTRAGLPEALNLIPGVSSTAGAGNRNETLISIRGFDRWQVPLLMDGIRLYLPADNRIDFDRFLTPDLAEVQVSKGYVSVLNGPDGMGGAINLVTRKPVKAFEGEVRASANLGGKGQYNGNTLYANVGGRQERYYYQASAQRRDVDHWRLSDDFKATAAEDGGRRDNTGKEDWRINLKSGFAPNDTDEYSLNFVKQSGDKSGIGSVSGTSTISPWTWPMWDTWSLYWLSHTQLDSKSYVKTRAYYNDFENSLLAYTNSSLTARNFISYYDDSAYGGSIEAGSEHLDGHHLKAALHYRRDNHTEWQYVYASSFTEPEQDAVESTWSLALEDTWALRSDLDIVLGISRDIRRSDKVEDYTAVVFFRQPVADSFATNYQGAAIYRYRGSGKLHFSVSDRTRFPTMFERFSSRFGGAVSNPWLDPERALNVELGISDSIAPGLHVEAALFHNRVKDAIQSVQVLFDGAFYAQSQNVGEATFRGAEISLTAALSPTLQVGGNYTYIDTEIDNPNDPGARLTTTPRHKAFAYAKWQVDALTVIPSIEYASSRWSTEDVPGGGFVRTGEYLLVGAKVEYAISGAWDVSLSGRNLLDQDYALVDGYPQEGRNFVVSTRYRY